MKFKPEEVNFHREEYQAALAEMRPKDYPLLFRKEVQGRIELRHRRSNPYVRDGKALVSFTLAGKDIKRDIQKSCGPDWRFWKILEIPRSYSAQGEL